MSLLPNPRVRFGLRAKSRGYGHIGIPGVGLVTYIRRTAHPGARKFGVERAGRAGENIDGRTESRSDVGAGRDD